MNKDTFKQQHPQEWAQAKKEALYLFRHQSPETIAAKMQQLGAELKRNNQSSPSAAIKLEALKETFQNIVDHKKNAPLSRVDARIAQYLFFSRKLERKSVSPLAFRTLWPFVTDKQALLMQLKSRGIYCAYSDRFAKKLKTLIKGRKCLEIGCGDGTLSLLLEKHGCYVQATDDKSWSHVIQYPDWVENLTAGQALQTYHPEVVFCSWPPPKNTFEAAVFAFPSVQTYVVIGTQHEFGSGNRETYKANSHFTCERNVSMEGDLFPPELQHEVLVFQRRR